MTLWLLIYYVIVIIGTIPLTTFYTIEMISFTTFDSALDFFMVLTSYVNR